MDPDVHGAQTRPAGTRVAELSYPVFAFVGSGCLLVLEIVAGRLLAPTLGVSLYTWTSVIGVVLAGVSLGNFLGGRIADRWPSRSALGLIYVAGSLASLAVLGLVHYVGSLELSNSSPAILQVLWLNAALFFVPSTCMAAATPLLTRLSLHSVAEGGRVVGRIQAAAALGSIVGTFLTGFLLISSFGTRWVVAGVALTLLLLAVCARPPWLRETVPAALTGVLAAGILAAGATSHSGCTVETNYFCIRVNDTADSTGDNLKLMRLDKLVHGISDLTHPTRLVYGYELLYKQVLDARFKPHSRIDSLLLGGGPYTLARYLSLTHTGRVLVAEIDPGVSAVARADFGLPPPGKTRIQTINQDARRVVANLPSGTRFDAIFGDTFNDYEVPYQLTTREFDRLVARHLKPKGLYLLNVVDGVHHDFLRSEIRTLRTVFPYVGVVRSGPWPPSRLRNTFVIVAANAAPASALPVIPAASIARFVAHGHSVVLTDDYAPVDQLLAPVFSQALHGG